MAMDDIRPPGLGNNKRGVDRLDRVKERLYKRQDETRPVERSPLRRHDHEAPKAWAHDREEHEVMRKKGLPSQRSRFWKSAFWFAAVFFVVSLGFAYFAIEIQGNRVSSDRIDITVSTRTFTDGGEALPVAIALKNKNPLPLENPRLFLEYPGRGAEGEVVAQMVSLSNLASGASTNEDFVISLYGEPGQEIPLTARLEYQVPDSTSTFQKTEQAGVTIRSTPVIVLLDTPTSVLSGQTTTFTVTVRPQSSDLVEDILLELEYPAGFSFSEASQVPVSGTNNRFAFDQLEPGGSVSIQILGSFDGFTGDEAAIKAFVGVTDPATTTGGIETIYHGATRVVRFSEPFMSTQVIVNGEEFADTLTATGGQTLNTKLFWEQLLDDSLFDVKLSAWMSGNVFDRTDVDPGEGFYDSQSGLIVWDSSTNDNLERVRSADSDTFSFKVGTYQLVGQGGQVIRDPEVTIAVDVLGRTPEGEILSIEDATVATVRFHSSLSLTPATHFYEGDFANTGPMPPRANMDTTYTVTWQTRNTSNRLRETEVRTKLPAYVTWLGVTSPGNETVTYNPDTREVIWQIGTLEPAVGYTTPPRQASFQLRVRPSLTHVGQVINITGDVAMQGLDTWTDTMLTVKKPPHTTKLSESFGVGSSGEVEQ